MADLYTRTGKLVTDGIVVGEDGKPGRHVRRACGRCGGAGKSAKWAHTGWTCYDCGGSGLRAYEWQKLYTAEQNARLDAAAAKRAERAQAKRLTVAAEREAQANQRRDTFLAIHADLLARADAVLAQVERPLLLDLVTRGRERATFSAAQLALVEKLVVEGEAAVEHARTAEHVGTVGDRLTLDVTVSRVAGYQQ